MVSSEQKKQIIEKFGGNTANTGDAKVQVALLTARINDLQGHFKANPKDHASRRGLLMLVGQRRRLLAYIKNRNIDEYRSLIAELGIRK
jgi:small subunit ribosomal protein S15